MCSVNICMHACELFSIYARAGISNVVTALSGAGMTGSYIFSQTIFSMKAGVQTRVHGFIIAGAPRLTLHRHHALPWPLQSPPQPL